MEDKYVAALINIFLTLNYDIFSSSATQASCYLSFKKRYVVLGQMMECRVEQQDVRVPLKDSSHGCDHGCDGAGDGCEVSRWTGPDAGGGRGHQQYSDPLDVHSLNARDSTDTGRPPAVA